MLRLPEHISEAEVLALIEGDLGSLPADRRDVVRDAVARDPVLSALVGEIKADASAVVSMSRVSAPSTIRQRVIEELRRPIPRSDFVREPAGGEIPVSSVVVSRESPWRRFVENVPLRKLAATASLVLAAGLGVWLIGNAVRQARIPVTTGPIALVPESSAPSPDAIVPIESLPRGIESNSSLALNLPEPGRLVSDPLVTDQYGFATVLRAEPPLIHDEPVAAPLAAGMPAAEAIELARAGRLIIRVRAANEAEAQAQIQQFALRTVNELKWRPLEPWELSDVTIALHGSPPKPLPMASEKRQPTAKNVLPTPSNDKPAPVIEPFGTAADVADALRNANFRPLYTVEMEENEGELATLLERLGSDKGRVAEFVALEQPLPTLMPSTDPAAVLWWTRPPSGWTRHVCVPIVLETLR